MVGKYKLTQSHSKGNHEHDCGYLVNLFTPRYTYIAHSPIFLRSPSIPRIGVNEQLLKYKQDYFSISAHQTNIDILHILFE